MKLALRSIFTAAVLMGVIYAIHQAEAAIAVAGPPSATPAPGVPVNPGDNLETAISGNPASTMFNLACGTYRMATDDTDRSALIPKAGDTFRGTGAFSATTIPSSAPCTILNGAIRVPNDSPDNAWHTTTVNGHTLWYNAVGAANTLSTTAGACLTRVFSSPAGASQSVGPCSYPQDLYFNDVPKARLDNTSATDEWTLLAPTVGSGSGYWYFDITGAHGAANRIYVADDPTSATVELSAVQYAFVGQNNNVTLQNLTLKHFSSPYQHGAVDDGGNSWLINANWFSHNHGYGVKPNPANAANGGHAPNTNTISYNEFYENGQAAMGDGADNNSVYSHNQMDRNGFANFAYGGEGGNKWVGAGIQILNNTCNYENGACFWSDTDNSNNMLFDSNAATGAVTEGMRLEISHFPTATRNTLTRDIEMTPNNCVALHVPLVNGLDACTGPQTASFSAQCSLGGTAPDEISCAQSDNCTVGGSVGNGNTITSDCGGMNESTGTRNPTAQAGVSFSYNTAIYMGSATTIPHRPGYTIGTGGVTPGPNTYDHNTYKFNGSGSGAAANANWNANGTNKTFAQWQLIPQDASGTSCSNC